MTLLQLALHWNYVLTAALLGSLTAQFAKVVLNLILLRKIVPERMWGAGGMPSAHSCTVCATVVAAGRYEGVHSTMFALATILAIIVMYDAMGVRRETGEQSKVLNQMILDWMSLGAHELPLLGDRKLKEMVGHTPLEVVVGALLGVLIGFALPMV